MRKRCNRCQRYRPLARFGRNRRYYDGRQPYCIECGRAKDVAHYRTSSMRRTAIVENTREQRRENRRRVREYLASHPCVDCGESDPVVLDFDHVRGQKRSAVSVLVGQNCAAWSTIVAEIAKCEVRCANCHRRRTARIRPESPDINCNETQRPPVDGGRDGTYDVL